MDRITAYAEGLTMIAAAEGNLDTVRSELAEVARGVDGNDELRTTLSNNLLPADVRGQIVDDLLAGKANDTTRAIVGLIVSAGRGAELGPIASAFSNLAAAAGGKKLALVRSAVPLSDDQQARLAAALQQRTGNAVDLQVEVDPSVVGGIVTTIEDDVIDGSVRTRLNNLRSVL